MNITVIAGSPREKSTSFKVAKYLSNYLIANNPEHKVTLLDVRNHDLPYIQNVFPSVEETPDQHKPLSEIIFKTDAFILVSPEYNGSYSSAMKNLLDHYPKQSKKTFGVVTSTLGGLGGIRAAQQMLLLVSGLFGIVSPNMLLVPTVNSKFDEEGNLLDENFGKTINGFFQDFLWLAEAVNK